MIMDGKYRRFPNGAIYRNGKRIRPTEELNRLQDELASARKRIQELEALLAKQTQGREVAWTHPVS